MRIIRKNIYLMILTFIIISLTIVTAALVQLEQFKTSSHHSNLITKNTVTIAVYYLLAETILYIAPLNVRIYK